MTAKTTKKTTPKTEALVSKATKLDADLLLDIMRTYPSREDVAAILKVHPDTVDKHIKKFHNMSFSEYRDQNMASCRHDLKRKALRMALEEGNVPMLIFCLKNLCGWKDKHENSLEEDKPIKLAYEVTVKQNEDGVWEM